MHHILPPHGGRAFGVSGFKIFLHWFGGVAAWLVLAPRTRAYHGQLCLACVCDSF